jgi:hypothetical protein
VASFKNILSSLRLQAAVPPAIPSRRASLPSRTSFESATGDDWYDAQSIEMPPEEGMITVVEQETESDHRPDEESEDEDDIDAMREGAISPLLTMVPKTHHVHKKVLYPVDEWKTRAVKRRNTLPHQMTVPPPSLLAFLRKNVPLPLSWAHFRWAKILVQSQCPLHPMSQRLSFNDSPKI